MGVNVFHVDVVSPVRYDGIFYERRVIKVRQRITKMMPSIRLKWQVALYEITSVFVVSEISSNSECYGYGAEYAAIKISMR